MKKFLRLTLVALCAMVSSVALADTYTYTFEKKVFSGEGTETLNGVDWTLTTDAGYFGYDSSNNDKGQQLGSGSKPATYVYLSTNGIIGTITSVKVNTSGASGIDATLDVTVGGQSFDSQYKLTTTKNDVEFTGSASGEIKLIYTNKAKAIYIKSIEVTYTKSATDVDMPTISGEESFDEKTEITITGPENSTIYYTTDGTDPTTSSTNGKSPLTFTLDKTATVKAIAVVGENQSRIASKDFTKVEFTDMTVADIQELTNDQEYVNLTIENGKVVYIDSRYDTPNVFIRDGENAIMFYSTNLPFTANATVKGTVKVNYVNFRGIHEAEDNSFTDATNLTITDSEEEAQPVTTTIADVLALKHKCDLVKIMNVTITDKDGKYYASDGENEIQLYGNDNAVKAYADDGKSYNVTAVFNSIYSDKAQLLPVAVEVSSGIENVTVEPEFNENAPVYNLAGQRVSKDAKGIVIQNGKKFIRK